MFGLSGSHLLIIGIIVLLFGSRRLPELGSSLGKGLRAFKKGLEGQDLLEENKDAAKREQIAEKSDRDPKSHS